MSSHREAPEISKDPVADSTDLYAFVSPDQPDTVTLISNYIPLEAPDGGPNFYEFGDDVLYEIHIDNDGDAARRRSPTSSASRPRYRNPEHLPLQHRADHLARQPQLEPAPVLFGDQGAANGKSTVLGTGLACPALQHRPALHAQLCRAGPGGRPHALQAAEGLRRAAARGLLRRPGRRSSTSATCGRSSSLHLIPSAGRSGVDSTKARERALHRHPGAQDRI